MQSRFYKSIIIYIVKWLLITFVLGFLGANLVLTLRIVIDSLRNFAEYTAVFTPLLGGAAVGLIIYYFDFRAEGLGTNRYIEYANKEKLINDPGKLLVIKFSNTGLTLGLMGVEGIVGPILLLGSSLASFLLQIIEEFQFNFLTKEHEYRVLNVCGAAAALGPLLGAPIGSGVFASEVLYKSHLNYDDLFPAILASSFGYFFYNFFYKIPSLDYNIYLPHLAPQGLILVIIVALIAGLVGQGIILIYNFSSNWFDSLSLSIITKLILAGGAAALLIELFNIDNIVTKFKIEEIIFSGLSIKILISLLLFKILITILVVSSGGSVAMVDTAILVGGLIGNLLHFILPLPLNSLVVVGMSAVLSSVANVPLATIILIPEIFGVNLSLTIVLGSIIGFFIGRAQTVYHYLDFG